MTESSRILAVTDAHTARSTLGWPGLVLGGAAFLLAAAFTVAAFA